jgi:hypothetical protein
VYWSSRFREWLYSGARGQCRLHQSTTRLQLQHPPITRNIAVSNGDNGLIQTTMEISSSRKRPRPVVSCLRCREKKLKCDRTAPCQNCSKAGCRAECTYNQHPQSSDSIPKAKRVHLSTEGDEEDQRTQSRPGTGIIEDLQERVVKLEELLAVRPHAGNFGPVRDAPVQGSWYVWI